MSEVCNDAISNFELLGRILNETSQINRSGQVKDKAMYPKLSYPDREVGRETFFSNKLSVVRLCRGYDSAPISWEHHVKIAKNFTERTNNVFRGFLIGRVNVVKSFDLEVVADGSEKNPFHAHIIIPDFNVPFTPGPTMISDVMPSEVRERLDRLRMQMKTVVLDRGERYPTYLACQNPSDPICNICPI